MMLKEELREALELLYRTYNRREFLGTDPLRFLYDFDRTGDRELVALVSSALAFGNVKQIMGSIESVRHVLGKSPMDYVMNSSPVKLRSAFSGFRHRWAGGEDLSCLLIGARHVIATHGSLESCFRNAYDESHRDILPALTEFVAEMTRGSGGDAGCLLPSPCGKSACKRLNLFLRWMVRHDDIDPGGWSGIPPAKLIVPLDIHMYRWGKTLGFTGRRQADLRSACEVTDGFREIAPEDPVRYDFTLTRLAVLRDGTAEKFLDHLGIDRAGLVN